MLEADDILFDHAQETGYRLCHVRAESTSARRAHSFGSSVADSAAGDSFSVAGSQRTSRTSRTRRTTGALSLASMGSVLHHSQLKDKVFAVHWDVNDRNTFYICFQDGKLKCVRAKQSIGQPSTANKASNSNTMNDNEMTDSPLYDVREYEVVFRQYLLQSFASYEDEAKHEKPIRMHWDKLLTIPSRPKELIFLLGVSPVVMYTSLPAEDGDAYPPRPILSSITRGDFPGFNYGTPILQINSQSARVTSLAVSPLGHILASGDEVGNVKLLLLQLPTDPEVDENDQIPMTTTSMAAATAANQSAVVHSVFKSSYNITVRVHKMAPVFTMTWLPLITQTLQEKPMNATQGLHRQSHHFTEDSPELASFLSQEEVFHYCLVTGSADRAVRLWGVSFTFRSGLSLTPLIALDTLSAQTLSLSSTIISPILDLSISRQRREDKEWEQEQDDMYLNGDDEYGVGRATNRDEEDTSEIDDDNNSTSNKQRTLSSLQKTSSSQLGAHGKAVSPTYSAGVGSRLQSSSRDGSDDIDSEEREAEERKQEIDKEVFLSAGTSLGTVHVWRMHGTVLIEALHSLGARTASEQALEAKHKHDEEEQRKQDGRVNLSTVKMSNHIRRQEEERLRLLALDRQRDVEADRDPLLEDDGRFLVSILQASEVPIIHLSTVLSQSISWTSAMAQCTDLHSDMAMVVEREMLLVAGDVRGKVSVFASKEDNNDRNENAIHPTGEDGLGDQHSLAIDRHDDALSTVEEGDEDSVARWALPENDLLAHIHKEYSDKRAMRKQEHSTRKDSPAAAMSLQVVTDEQLLINRSLSFVPLSEDCFPQPVVSCAFTPSSTHRLHDELFQAKQVLTHWKMIQDDRDEHNQGTGTSNDEEQLEETRLREELLQCTEKGKGQALMVTTMDGQVRVFAMNRPSDWQQEHQHKQQLESSQRTNAAGSHHRKKALLSSAVNDLRESTGSQIEANVDIPKPIEFAAKSSRPVDSAVESMAKKYTSSGKSSMLSAEMSREEMAFPAAAPPLRNAQTNGSSSKLGHSIDHSDAAAEGSLPVPKAIRKSVVVQSPQKNASAMCSSARNLFASVDNDHEDGDSDGVDDNIAVRPQSEKKPVERVSRNASSRGTVSATGSSPSPAVAASPLKRALSASKVKPTVAEMSTSPVPVRSTSPVATGTPRSPLKRTNSFAESAVPNASSQDFQPQPTQLSVTPEPYVGNERERAQAIVKAHIGTIHPAPFAENTLSHPAMHSSKTVMDRLLSVSNKLESDDISVSTIHTTQSDHIKAVQSLNKLTADTATGHRYDGLTSAQLLDNHDISALVSKLKMKSAQKVAKQVNPRWLSNKKSFALTAEDMKVFAFDEPRVQLAINYTLHNRCTTSGVNESKSVLSLGTANKGKRTQPQQSSEDRWKQNQQFGLHSYVDSDSLQSRFTLEVNADDVFGDRIALDPDEYRLWKEKHFRERSLHLLSTHADAQHLLL